MAGKQAKTASKNAPENRKGPHVNLCPVCNDKRNPVMVFQNHRKKVALECKCGMILKNGVKIS
ncbi:MAG: hypothetical protein ACLFQK_09355 [Fibrobacterota bacterium]